MESRMSSQSSSTHSIGYRRRTRSAKTNKRSVATTFRSGPKSSSPKQGVQDDPIVIPFPIPSNISKDWLLKTAPIVLARHFIYARGLWPMSFHQLLLLQQQELLKEEEKRAVGGGEKTKKRRLNNAHSINPTIRKKQQRAMNQITRMCDEWTRYSVAASNSARHHDTSQESEKNEGHQKSPLSMPMPLSSPKMKLPGFVMLALGPSFGRAREFYLLDFGSISEEFNTRSSFKDDVQEQKFEAMLARKLISSLMNHSGNDGRSSVINSLPTSTSPSFRLWISIGFENQPDSKDTSSICYDDSLLSNSSTRRTESSPLSTVSWIPRNKFPLMKKTLSKPFRRQQSMVTIRFFRSQKQNRSMEQHNANQIVNDSNGEEAGYNLASSHLQHTKLEQMTWMSLSSCVKGFRL